MLVHGVRQLLGCPVARGVLLHGYASPRCLAAPRVSCVKGPAPWVMHHTSEAWVFCAELLNCNCLCLLKYLHLALNHYNIQFGLHDSLPQ